MQNDQDIHTVFYEAFTWFNRELFENKLETCVIVVHRKRGARGYFWAEQWINTATGTGHHEIAMNPDTFEGRTTKEILSTLAHEMVHMYQEQFGAPGKGGYHNLEWVDMMERVGLEPYATDHKGRQTGTKVSHTVIDGGMFDVTCDAFTRSKSGAEIVWQTKTPSQAENRTARAKRSSKTKFTCPTCKLNAWAKQDAALGCWTCGVEMEDNDG